VSTHISFDARERLSIRNALLTVLTQARTRAQAEVN
jgi:hypothetical protein